jgi:hypothetical protein
MTIHTSIGDQKTIEDSYTYHLGQLMRDKRFIGMVSGKGSEALYVVGCFQ